VIPGGPRAGRDHRTPRRALPGAFVLARGLDGVLWPLDVDSRVSDYNYSPRLDRNPREAGSEAEPIRERLLFS